MVTLFAELFSVNCLKDSFLFFLLQISKRDETGSIVGAVQGLTTISNDYNEQLSPMTDENAVAHGIVIR